MLETEEAFEFTEPRLSTVVFSWWLIVCGAIGFLTLTGSGANDGTGVKRDALLVYCGWHG